MHWLARRQRRELFSEDTADDGRSAATRHLTREDVMSIEEELVGLANSILES